jgi:hypothetical protein
MEETAFSAAHADQPSVPDPVEAEFRALSDECVQACLAQVGADATISEKLVKLYLIWRRMRGTQLMAQLHQQEDLSLPDYDDAVPDFIPFVKIAFRLDLQRTPEDKERIAHMNAGTRRNKQSGYVAVLARLHVEYEGHPRRYVRDPYEQLLGFHKSEEAGGIEGAREWRAQRNRTVAGSTASRSSSGSALRTSLPAAVQAAQQWVHSRYRHVEFRTTITRGRRSFRVGKVQFDVDDRHIAIQGCHGLTLSDVANDSQQTAARLSAHRLRSMEPGLLRTLAEVVYTQAYPKVFAPPGSRTDLASPYSQWEQRLYPNAPRYLVILQDRILLSPIGQPASVVTMAKPATSFLPEKVKLVCAIGPETAGQIEELLDCGALAGMRVCPSKFRVLPSCNAPLMLNANAQSGLDSRPLKLAFRNMSKALKRSQNLTLDLTNFTPDWSFSASTAWFDSLRSDFFDRWFQNQGKHNRILRDENRRFSLHVDVDLLTIGFEINPAGVGPKHLVILGGRDSKRAKLRSGSPGTCEVASADLARVFCAMPDFCVRGRIAVEGNDRLILLTFATDVGDFHVGIPTVQRTANGLVRNPSYMTSL